MFDRMISKVWNIKKQHRSYSKFNFTIRKNNICHIVLLLSPLCFKNYIVQMLVFTTFETSP